MQYPTYSIEKEIIALGYTNIAGADEVGRGCGSGPVVSAVVRIPQFSVNLLENKVKDSKKLSAKKREGLCRLIIQTCDCGIGSIDNRIIDEINILEATKLAMRLAISEINKVDYVIIDGNFTIKELDIPHHAVVKGDSLSLSIAAASIVAKVTRDNIMRKLHNQFPLYCWDENKGYLTKKHLEALNLYGPCEHHRLSFNKVDNKGV